MTTINDIASTPAPGLDIPGPMWLREALDQQLDAGKSFLVAGTAGIGKSTMTLQLLGALSSQGIKTLYLPSEQTPDAVKRTVERLFGPEMPSAIAENLHIDTILDLAAIPLSLPAQIIRPHGEYYGTRVVVIDSLQSAGLGTQMDTKYCALKQFIKWARGAGIICIFVSHVTKDGKIAGPKDLGPERGWEVY